MAEAMVSRKATPRPPRTSAEASGGSPCPAPSGRAPPPGSGAVPAASPVSRPPRPAATARRRRARPHRRAARRPGVPGHDGESCGLRGALPAWEHQRRGRARVGGTHERDHRAVVGGTHQRDRCTWFIGSVKDEPGQGDLRDLNVCVWTPGAHCVSFPLTGPAPGVQSCGRWPSW
jgi:hypothetical protein